MEIIAAIISLPLISTYTIGSLRIINLELTLTISSTLGFFVLTALYFLCKYNENITCREKKSNNLKSKYINLLNQAESLRNIESIQMDFNKISNAQIGGSDAILCLPYNFKDLSNDIINNHYPPRDDLIVEYYEKNKMPYYIRNEFYNESDVEGIMNKFSNREGLYKKKCKESPISLNYYL